MTPRALARLPYAAAIRWFRERVVVTDREFQALEERAQNAAWAATAYNKLEVARTLYAAIDSAIVAGLSYAAFRKSLPDTLKSKFGPKRGQAIYRNNVMQSYNAARFDRQTQEDAVLRRPWGLYSTVADNRRSEICASRAGRVFRLDEPFDNPPLHSLCRTTVIALRDSQMRRLGLTPPPGDPLPPDAGFGGRPQKFAPKQEDYTHEAWEAYEKSLKKRGKNA